MLKKKPHEIHMLNAFHTWAEPGLPAKGWTLL